MARDPVLFFFSIFQRSVVLNSLSTNVFPFFSHLMTFFKAMVKNDYDDDLNE